VEENAECSAIKFDDDDGLVASLWTFTYYIIF
jgi:hypothetical protein